MAQLWRECTRCRRRRFLANRAGPPRTELWDGCPDCPELADKSGVFAQVPREAAERAAASAEPRR